jgi:acyl-CoA reductase-like NAD-dependent aldehyde dehydrogenase
LYEIGEATDAQVAEVFARAHKAYDVIRKMTVRQRLDETMKLLHYIRDNREMILDRVMAETGKTRYEAILSEIFTVLDMIDYYNDHAEKLLADLAQWAKVNQIRESLGNTSREPDIAASVMDEIERITRMEGKA